MNRTAIVIVAVVLGTICLAIWQFWPSYAQSKSTWTEEKAKKHAAVAHELHELSYGAHSHGSTRTRPKRPTPEEEAEHKAELEATRKSFEIGKTELDEQQNAGNGVATVCFWAALGLFGGGIAFYFVSPEK